MILDGELENVDYEQHPIFGLYMPKYCPGVPSEMLDPMNTWLQKGLYVSKAIQLAHSFHINFDKFINQASDEIMHGAPLIDAHQIMEDI